MSTATAGKVLLIPKGEYDATTQYKVLDWVLYQGRPYVAKQTTTGNAPIYAPTPQNPDAYWQLMLDFPTLVDNVPTENSNNLVKSGGVYSALATKQNTLTFDNAPTAGSTNPVTSDGIATALSNKQDTLTFDNAPTQNSNNPVKSGGVYSALQDAGHTIKDSTTTFPNRANLVFDEFDVTDDPTNNATVVKIPFDYSSVSWANSPIQDIQKMLDAHYRGEIDISDYWSIGDERVVEMSYCVGIGGSESHPAQQTTFVIMNFGGKKLSSDGVTDVAAIVGQKGIYANGVANYELGPMNGSDTTDGGWDSCSRRTWCNNGFKNALPADFAALFKLFNNVTANGSGTSTAVSADYFALPSEKEVFGTASYANATAEASNSQFKYYETAANRVKKKLNGSADGYGLRSPMNGNTSRYCAVNSSGESYSYGAGATQNWCHSMFGCI